MSSGIDILISVSFCTVLICIKSFCISTLSHSNRQVLRTKCYKKIKMSKSQWNRATFSGCCLSGRMGSTALWIPWRNFMQYIWFHFLVAEQLNIWQILSFFLSFFLSVPNFWTAYCLQIWNLIWDINLLNHLAKLRKFPEGSGKF